MSSVERLDVLDIADELEDSIVALGRGGADPAVVAELQALAARTWEAARLNAAGAHALREYRFRAQWAAEQ